MSHVLCYDVGSELCYDWYILGEALGALGGGTGGTRILRVLDCPQRLQRLRRAQPSS